MKCHHSSGIYFLILSARDVRTWKFICALNIDGLPYTTRKANARVAVAVWLCDEKYAQRVTINKCRHCETISKNTLPFRFYRQTAYVGCRRADQKKRKSSNYITILCSTYAQFSIEILYSRRGLFA